MNKVIVLDDKEYNLNNLSQVGIDVIDTLMFIDRKMEDLNTYVDVYKTLIQSKKNILKTEVLNKIAGM